MIVIISDEAEADLEYIGDYIARNNALRAETFVVELVEACVGLAEFPKRFALVPRYEDRGVRRRPHGRYLIFYKLEADRLDVLRILNAAQDYERILFPED